MTMKRHKLQSKQVEGEWVIESMEGKSYPFVGKPKAVARQLEALGRELLGRTARLESGLKSGEADSGA